MFYREIFSLCSHIHTKHLNTLNGQNVVVLNYNLAVTYSIHWASDGEMSVI